MGQSMRIFEANIYIVPSRVKQYIRIDETEDRELDKRIYIPLLHQGQKGLSVRMRGCLLDAKL
jgi:hypothetical protein